jgi:hypothetical protein
LNTQELVGLERRADAGLLIWEVLRELERRNRELAWPFVKACTMANGMDRVMVTNLPRTNRTNLLMNGAWIRDGWRGVAKQ